MYFTVFIATTLPKIIEDIKATLNFSVILVRNHNTRRLHEGGATYV